MKKLLLSVILTSVSLSSFAANTTTTNLLTPKVKVFFSSKSNLRIHPEVIDLSKPGIKDKIESTESDFKISQQEISDLLTIND